MMLEGLDSSVRLVIAWLPSPTYCIVHHNRRSAYTCSARAPTHTNRIWNSKGYCCEDHTELE